MVKQRIIEEASELFGRSGVKSITMDDLAQHLSISKRTIYANFRNKEELLIACIDAFSKEKIVKQQNVFHETDNVFDAILAILHQGAGKSRFKVICDIRKYNPQVYKEHLLRLQTEKRRKIEQLIQRGIREGVFRDDLNAKIIAHIFCAYNYEDFDRFSLLDIVDIVAITILRGICTIKGNEILDDIIKIRKIVLK